MMVGVRNETHSFASLGNLPFDDKNMVIVKQIVGEACLVELELPSDSFSKTHAPNGTEGEGGVASGARSH